MEFEIIKTDIVNVPADAVVLPANPELKEGSGVSAALFKAAGRTQLARACKKLQPCRVGSSTATLAFQLDARFIIHAVVPRWIDGQHGEYDLLCSAYLSALRTAECLECSSIVFPLLASGNNGFDLDLAFEIAQKSFETFQGVHLERITLVIYGEHIASIVKQHGISFRELPNNYLAVLTQEEAQRRKKQNRERIKEVMHTVLDKSLDMALAVINSPEMQEILRKESAAIVDKCLQGKSGTEEKAFSRGKSSKSHK